MRRAFRALALPLALLAAAELNAAEIRIINTNTGAEGFNDPTPANPVGGNTGTTIGQQRLKVFEEVAKVWGSLLPSTVRIDVDASFVSLTCDATSAVLGSAGTRTVHADFDGALLPSTWYHQALANKLSGQDEDTETSDIRARFNSRLGSTGCLTGSGFYYGLDGNNGDLVDLFSVVLHELGHGLGFQSFVDGETGELFEGMGDVFSHNLFDNVSRRSWDQMTDAERATSAVDDGGLVWTGAAGTNAAPWVLQNKPGLTVSAPVGVAGQYPVGTAEFGPALTLAGVTGQLVRATDTGTSTTDGCEAITNGAAIAGNIALIDRVLNAAGMGTCTFVIKVKNAQNAGARGVVIAHNDPGSPPAGMAGTDSTITIPSVRITKEDADKLKANLPATVRIGLDPKLLAGADATGHLLLYAPTEFSGGSSVSHFDTSASPNLLMEPFINDDLDRDVDATLDVFRDLGWFADERPLVLSNGRVAVTVEWRNQYSGERGRAFGIPQKNEFGFFYFSDPNNPEVFVKVLDFGASNPNAQCFVGGLTTFEYRVTFRSVNTGRVLVFEKPAGALVGFANGSGLIFGSALSGGELEPQLVGTLDLGEDRESAIRVSPESAAWTAALAGEADFINLSRGRVEVRVEWRNQYNGQSGVAYAIPQKDEFAFFYFTDPNNPEVFVKVLDFGAGKALTFVGGLSDLYYKVTFKILRTGQTLVFEKAAGALIGFADGDTLLF